VEDNRRLADKLGLDFSLLSDSDRRTIAAYGVVHAGGGMGGRDIARPATLVIGANARVRWRSVTENWRVRVRPETVIDALGSTAD
jgi:peroxiredoxin